MENRTNPLAIASFVLAMLGIFSLGITSFVGLFLGIASVEQIRKTNERGEALAVIAIVIGGMSALFLFFWIIGMSL